VTDLKLERELCDGVQRHAAYSRSNPKQADAWPDAHEEYRDKEGYTPEGHWGGTHADIGPALDNPEEAIDVWMGTFYHRIPMLVPELRRIGWGQAGPFAAIDIQSFVVPPEGEWTVVWPPDGMKEVPIDFAGKADKELPNPVIEDPSQNFGYPVTLQLGNTKPDAPSPQINMKLLDGRTRCPAGSRRPTSRRTPTWRSRTPGAAPQGQAQARHDLHGHGEWYLTGNKISWTFKTGS